MANNAHLTVDAQELELERVQAVSGNDGFKINTMLAETGTVTLDPGFTNTASCTSEITYIDGDAGILRYRGYPIEQLAEHCSFLEVAYLLIYGQLPDVESLAAFTHRIKRHTLLHEDFRSFFTAFPSSGHPMSILQAGVAGLGTYYQDTLDPVDKEQRNLASVLLLAKLPTMIAYISKRATGLPLLYPDAAKSYTEDFIRMTFALPYQNHDIDPTIVNALDKLFILHADHEQNCSTSTVRLVGSSQANIYASVAAGVGALSGPLHGGANEAVLSMLDNLRESGTPIKEFVSQVKDKTNNVKLMGFGHRVYKNYDPRAKIVKGLADDILGSLSGDEELFDMARELEQVALEDDYFVERHLYPNVDFYTGLIYKAMGFPTKMFTPLFALGRLPGWIAQYHELVDDPAQKIGRPRQVYIGADERDWVPLSERNRGYSGFREPIDYQV
ncbi:citrate synthase [Arcanobacterium haemolyticum]|uniref:Citrate synthase n=1 Tax=Arcanobacterium haemolyticum (strain ATCC 9345 / DSM 20595 / CCM 5947 / CCUG 17215 / LMG 16163 / NBRC 15585 / NCTC 8452 / 11018) TaxID=644284 RepID=D7BKF5_ARCHD|nr:citrate synthase [Arcanobacterium haemolyticum]ADH93135.1 citrate synthase I [Arcanobacterium haemolyticum DSM 20595]QCX47192.1 citrate synthase [Arcanobacterium haemolyticum]SQH28108.1 Citrate synthase 1 [Arcanobacterium haemolyticum]